MNDLISRRRWIRQTSCALAAVTLSGALTHAQPTTSPAKKKKDKGPPIAPELVREFVGAGHGNIERVKEMLAQYPTIVNGVWDWGGGDYETALGGASHMGRPDIAIVLLEHNARLDIFAAAMLGRIEIVKAACLSFPNTPNVPGPHGITLIAHAERGGDAAKPVLEYLESLK